MAKIVEPLDPENRFAKENREQLIGAAPSYLWFAQHVTGDLKSLQQLVTDQDNGHAQ